MEENRTLEIEKRILDSIYKTDVKPTYFKGEMKKVIETNFSIVFIAKDVNKKARINGDKAQKDRIMITIYEQ